MKDPVAKAAILSLLLATVAFGQQQPLPTNETRDCGTPVRGISLCLSKTASDAKLLLLIKNTGLGTVLNLGSRLSNHMEYVTAVSLVLIDSSGNSHRAECSGGGVVGGGNIYPLIAQLPSGGSFEIPIFLTKCDFRINPTKRYVARAQFKGEAAGQAPRCRKDDLFDKNCGLELLPYWTGRASSNGVTLFAGR
jgi:hypothetical protein